MRRIYVDLDGVMANFDAHFPALFGVDHRSLLDDEMWEYINNHPSFFRDIPLFEGALDFWDFVVNLTWELSLEDPIILTACSKMNYANVAKQKREWVREHLEFGYGYTIEYPMVLPVMGGRNKVLFMHDQGDVLIDDWEKNTIPWDEAGGNAILHTDFPTTMWKLETIYNLVLS